MRDKKHPNGPGDPDVIVNVRLPTQKDGFWIEFADGTSGFVTWRDVKMSAHLSSIKLDSIAPDEFGSAVQFESESGGTFDVDALAIKTLIDQDAAGRVATWVQRSDQRVAQQVRTARLRSGITQSDLGKRAGMDQAVISKLERGLHRPRIDTLRRIAEALGLSLTDLLKAAA